MKSMNLYCLVQLLQGQPGHIPAFIAEFQKSIFYFKDKQHFVFENTYLHLLNRDHDVKTSVHFCNKLPRLWESIIFLGRIQYLILVISVDLFIITSF